MSQVEPEVYTDNNMAYPEMQLHKIANHPYLVQMPVEVNITNSESILEDYCYMLNTHKYSMCRFIKCCLMIGG